MLALVKKLHQQPTELLLSLLAGELEMGARAESITGYVAEGASSMFCPFHRANFLRHLLAARKFLVGRAERLRRRRRRLEIEHTVHTHTHTQRPFFDLAAAAERCVFSSVRPSFERKMQISQPARLAARAGTSFEFLPVRVPSCRARRRLVT